MQNLIRYKLLMLTLLLNNFFEINAQDYKETQLYGSDCEICECSTCNGSGIMTKKDWIVCTNCEKWSREYRSKIPCSVCYDNRGKYSNPYKTTCVDCNGKGRLKNRVVEVKKNLKYTCTNDFKNYTNEIKDEEIINDIYDFIKDQDIKIILFNYGIEVLNRYKTSIESLSIITKKISTIETYFEFGQKPSCKAELELACMLKLKIAHSIKSGKIAIKYRISCELGESPQKKLMKIESVLTQDEKLEAKKSQEKRDAELLEKQIERKKIKEIEKRDQFEEAKKEYIGRIKEAIEYKKSGKKHTISYKNDWAERKLQIAPTEYYLEGLYSFQKKLDINRIDDVEITFTESEIESETNEVKSFSIKFKDRKSTSFYRVGNANNEKEFFVDLVKHLDIIFYHQDQTESQAFREFLYKWDLIHHYLF